MGNLIHLTVCLSARSLYKALLMLVIRSPHPCDISTHGISSYGLLTLTYTVSEPSAFFSASVTHRPNLFIEVSCLPLNQYSIRLLSYSNQSKKDSKLVRLGAVSLLSFAVIWFILLSVLDS